MLSWLDERLKEKIKKTFEKNYKRSLTDEEIIAIATNLTDFMEAYLRFKLKQKNEDKQSHA